MIPKIIHFCWLSADPYPELVTKCINSWQKIIPEYELCLWDTKRIDINSNVWVKQAYEQQKYAFAADFIRLYALYNYGGIYLDSDVEVLKNFDPLLNHQSFIGLERGGDLEPAIIGSEPGCQWIKQCMSYYTDKSFIKNSGQFDMKPLPLILEEILYEQYKIRPQPSFYDDINLKVYPPEYFSPKSFLTKDIKVSNDTYTIHHFDGQWISNGIKTKLKFLIHKITIRIIGEKRHNDFIKIIRKICLSVY